MSLFRFFRDLRLWLQSFTENDPWEWDDEEGEL